VHQLARNLEVNRLTNVELVAAALDEQTGIAVLHQADRVNTGMSSIASAAPAPGSTVNVRSVRGDDFLKERPHLSPTIMKIDVEGAEPRVLAGAARLLESGRVRALVFEDRVGARGEPTNVSVLARLSSAGYQVRPLGASAENVGDGMFNYLATRPALAGTGT
jgi:FkbM family methyltransferase